MTEMIRVASKWKEAEEQKHWRQDEDAVCRLYIEKKKNYLRKWRGCAEK